MYPACFCMMDCLKRRPLWLLITLGDHHRPPRRSTIVTVYRSHSDVLYSRLSRDTAATTCQTPIIHWRHSRPPLPPLISTVPSISHPNHHVRISVIRYGLQPAVGIIRSICNTMSSPDSRNDMQPSLQFQDYADTLWPRPWTLTFDFLNLSSACIVQR